MPAGDLNCHKNEDHCIDTTAPFFDERGAQFCAVGLGLILIGINCGRAKEANRISFRSLSMTKSFKLSKIKYSALPRGQMTIGIEKKPIKNLNLHTFTSVALLGDRRSGKTTYLLSSILNGMSPWWHRLIFPQFGLFLTGTQVVPQSDSGSRVRLVRVIKIHGQH
jgi:hypothetical protein